MPTASIPSARPADSAMAQTPAAGSRNDDGSRPRAVTHRRPSGRSHPTRIDPSTITSPTTRSRTQISPAVRGGNHPRPHHTDNRAPPAPTSQDALLQISHHAEQSAADFGLQCAGEDLNLHGLLRPLGPQPSASTNSATSARGTASVARDFRHRHGFCLPLRDHGRRLEPRDLTAA
jgi:hypothetical protein